MTIPKPVFRTLTLVSLFLAQSASVAANEAEWALARGQAALGEGEAATALEIFEHAARQFPNDQRFRYLAGVAAERAGKFDRAYEHLRVLDTPEGQKSFRSLDFEFGRLHYLRGEYAEAEKRFAAYTARIPQDVLALIWLGETKLRLGKDEEAFNAFGRAGKIDPKLRAIFHFTRGTRVFLANAAEAADELKRAVETGRTGPVARMAEEFLELAAKKEELERWYSFDAAIGVAHDNNMLSHTKVDPGRVTGQRAILSLAGFARPKVGERAFLGTGVDVRHAQALAADQTKLPSSRPTGDYSQGSYSFFLDGSYYIATQTAAWEPGLEYSLRYATLGGRGLELSHAVYPRALLYHSSQTATKAYGIAQLQTLYDVSDLAPLARFQSGNVFGAGLAHYRVFADRLDAMTLLAEYLLRSADNAVGGDGEYQGPRFGVNMRKRLVADLYGELATFASYRMRNDASHPSDLLLAADGTLGYLFFGHLEVDLGIGYSANVAAVEHAYDRLQLGVFARGIF